MELRKALTFNDAPSFAGAPEVVAVAKALQRQYRVVVGTAGVFGIVTNQDVLFPTDASTPFKVTTARDGLAVDPAVPRTGIPA